MSQRRMVLDPFSFDQKAASRKLSAAAQDRLSLWIGNSGGQFLILGMVSWGALVCRRRISKSVPAMLVEQGKFGCIEYI